MIPYEYKKKIILHIGSYKTATSSLQNFFYKNKVELYEKHSILYPNTGLKLNDNKGARHYGLFHALKKNNDSFFKALLSEIDISKANTTILSAEVLSRLQQADIKLLSSYLIGFDVQVIYIIRRQDLFVESLFSEYVQYHGNILSPFDFIAKHQRLTLYNRIYDDWVEEFGCSSVKVLGFEYLKKNGILDCFFSELNLDLEITRNNSLGKSNKSLDRSGVKLMLYVNEIIEDANERRKFGDFISCEIKNKKPFDAFKLFDIKQRNNFMNKYTKNNSKLMVNHKNLNELLI